MNDKEQEAYSYEVEICEICKKVQECEDFQKEFNHKICKNYMPKTMAAYYPFETINDSIREIGLRFQELNETLIRIERDTRFFVELVEECLPLDDWEKRRLHERAGKRVNQG